MLIANPLGDLASDTFFAEVIKGAAELLKGFGRPLLLESFDGRASGPLPDMVAQERVCGIIVGGIPIDDEVVRRLAQTLPAVFIGRYLNDYQSLSAVISDNHTGGREAGEHLISLGYEHFIFLGGDLRTNTFAHRLQGFKEAIEGAGFSLSKEQIFTGDINQQGGYAATKELIPRLPKGRTGIFAATDWMAAGVLRALQEEGVPIPEEVGVVGYSDIDLASHIYPSLSSVRVEKEAMGYLAARILLDELEESIVGPVQVYLQPHLVARESTLGANHVLKEKA
jgi:DNA-binding LacI/PurR family transcriptional regulator